MAKTTDAKPVTRKVTKIPCAFCKGKGVDPYRQLSHLSTCGVCHGKKWLEVPTVHVPCIFCKGSGSDKTFSCPVCRGMGVRVPLKEPNRICQECEGRSYLHSNGMVCLVCKGYGRITCNPVVHGKQLDSTKSIKKGVRS